MWRFRSTFLLSAAVILLATACGGTAEPEKMNPPATQPITTSEDVPPETNEAATTTEGVIEGSVDGRVLPPDLDRSSFVDPTNIDHKYFPLTPGSQIVLEGFTIDFEEDEEIPHTIVFTVTEMIKEIDGVTSVVVWILDLEEGELVEAEIAFFAQDVEGNVWNMGEYPEEYEDGVFVLAPAWISGIEGAKAGVHMPANPRPDTPSFPQGWGPAVEWWDRGVVFEVGSQTCVILGCYEDVLIVDEFGLDELTFFQVKYYAPGIGNVQVGWKGNDPSGETLELLAHNILVGAELEAANEAALALEASAYERNEAYRQTEPMVRR